MCVYLQPLCYYIPFLTAGACLYDKEVEVDQQDLAHPCAVLVTIPVSAKHRFQHPQEPWNADGNLELLDLFLEVLGFGVLCTEDPDFSAMPRWGWRFEQILSTSAGPSEDRVPIQCWRHLDDEIIT